MTNRKPSKNSTKDKSGKEDSSAKKGVNFTEGESQDTASAGNMADMHDMAITNADELKHPIPMEQPAWFKEVSTKWFKEVSDKLSCVASINEKLSSIEKKLTAANDTAEFASQQAKDAIDMATASHKIAKSVQQENERLKHEIAQLKERVTQQECQSRRNNLLFDGIPESKDKETWADCEKLIIDIIVKKMGISADGLVIERAHRIGQQVPNKTRTVIAKFLSYKAREAVWNKRSQLKQTDIRVSEDFPNDIINERRILYPIFKAAKNNTTIKSAKLQVNKLYINNKEYTCKTLNELPSVLKPENLSTKRANGVTIFSSRNSVLSNLYSEAMIPIEGNTYRSTEQYYQCQKAMFFNDDKSASLIMAENDPYRLMTLGYRIKGYDEAKWLPEARRVLFKANMAKFSHLKPARDALLATGNDVIGEATQNATFGTGFRLHDPEALDPYKWTGDNLFGRILQEVRENLKEEDLSLSHL